MGIVSAQTKFNVNNCVVQEKTNDGRINIDQRDEKMNEIKQKGIIKKCSNELGKKPISFFNELTSFLKNLEKINVFFHWTNNILKQTF